MAAMKMQSTNMSTKLGKKEMQQSIQDDSDEEMSAASENSDGEERSSLEDNDEASGEERSEDESENQNEEESDEEEDEEDSAMEEESEDGDVSDEDGSEGDSDEEADDEIDKLSDDGDLAAGDWMEVDGNEAESSLSSSDDEVSPKNIDQSADNTDPKLHANAGWADAMAKILRMSKPKGKKSIVLAKAKKLSQVDASVKSDEEKKDYGFEIDGEADEEKDVKPKVDDIDVKPDLADIKPKPKIRQILSKGRTKPDILSRERERALAKIATKGVVQLFNAVREQQKDIHNKIKAVKGFRREENVLKSVDKTAFLNSLMGNTRSEKVEDHVKTKIEEHVKTKDEEDVKPQNSATWNVLRDNFLTGSNLKDWDKGTEIKVEDDMDEIELN